MPPLPKEAFEPSPINNDKPMIYEFEFFWMPPEVDGEILDVNCIEKRAKAEKFGEHRLGYNSCYGSIRSDPKINEFLKKGYWFAIPKNPPVEETANKSFKEQKDYIKDNYPQEFGLIRTREALIYCLMHRARDGDCALGRNPWRITRCEEEIKVEGFDGLWPVAVGAAAPPGLYVSRYSDIAYSYVCGLPVRRFY